MLAHACTRVRFSTVETSNDRMSTSRPCTLADEGQTVRTIVNSSYVSGASARACVCSLYRRRNPTDNDFIIRDDDAAMMLL